MLLAIFFLLSSLLFSTFVSKKLFKNNLFFYIFPISVLFSTWSVFLISLGVGFGPLSIFLSATLNLLITLFFLRGEKVDYSSFLEKNLIPFSILLIIAFSFLSSITLFYSPSGIKKSDGR